MGEYLLLLLILLPLVGALFILTIRDDRQEDIHNIHNVAIWILGATLLTTLYTFSLVDIEKNGIQIVEKYNWLEFPPVVILLGADVFSLLLLFGVGLSFFISEICLIRQLIDRPKALVSSELLFLGLLNGYFLAADIVSFYIFFAAVSMPLIVLISIYSSRHRKNMIIRLNLYHTIGALLLFIAVITIYTLKNSNIPLNTAGNLNLTGKTEYFVWLAIFFAFISRMPIWPFHYWLTAINSSIRNPMVFVAGNLISLVGLYGFMRFWPNTVPETIAIYAPIFEVVSALTMIFIALIGLSQKDFRYKLFSYTTVYYLFYLIGVFLPTGGLKMNIGYSLFAYLIIITVLSFLISHIEQQKKQLNLKGGGVLCYLPRTSVCLSLFVLASIGLPITPLFWNNFIIISEIFNHNLILGVAVILAMFLAALSFLEELYRLKDKSFSTDSCIIGKDLSDFEIFVYGGCLVILFFSFFRPLWFVF
jgi:NADH-quinone oxidoreductase subunit M